MVDDGRLATWLLDSASARQLGMRTTGHAARGTGGPPSPAPTNFYLEKGTISPAALRVITAASGSASPCSRAYTKPAVISSSSGHAGASEKTRTTPAPRAIVRAIWAT